MSFPTTDVRTRAERITWAKERALAELEAGSVGLAYASITSDLNKHSQTRGHSAILLGMRLAIGGRLSTPAQMREFIKGIQ